MTRAGLQFIYDIVMSTLTIVLAVWLFFALVGVNAVSIAVALADGGGALGFTWWWALKRAVPDA